VKLRVGYELQYEFPQPTPLIAMLNVHFSRVADLAAPDHIVISPSVPISCYRDGFGNWCSRIVAPAGQVRLSTVSRSIRFVAETVARAISGAAVMQISPAPFRD
jgi:transglutaminase-like putative cysteine protease